MEGRAVRSVHRLETPLQRAQIPHNFPQRWHSDPKTLPNQNIQAYKHQLMYYRMVLNPHSITLSDQVEQVGLVHPCPSIPILLVFVHYVPQLTVEPSVIRRYLFHLPHRQVVLRALIVVVLDIHLVLTLSLILFMLSHALLQLSDGDVAEIEGRAQFGHLRV
mgnify:CR=1 FL=1